MVCQFKINFLQVNPNNFFSQLRTVKIGRDKVDLSTAVGKPHGTFRDMYGPSRKSRALVKHGVATVGSGHPLGGGGRRGDHGPFPANV